MFVSVSSFTRLIYQKWYFFIPIVVLQDGQFYTSDPTPARWFHIVLNYIGPNDGEGIRIYYNGVKVASDTTKGARSRSAGDGRIVVGRGLTNKDKDYASVQVDELLFFNCQLSSADSSALATAT